MAARSILVMCLLPALHLRLRLAFPTRRSSDLLPRWEKRSSRKAPSMISTCSSKSRWRRSEEHTSELQSRADLVCRLLLDKKHGLQRQPDSGTTLSQGTLALSTLGTDSAPGARV